MQFWKTSLDSGRVLLTADKGFGDLRSAQSSYARPHRLKPRLPRNCGMGAWGLDSAVLERPVGNMSHTRDVGFADAGRRVLNR